MPEFGNLTRTPGRTGMRGWGGWSDVNMYGGCFKITTSSSSMTVSLDALVAEGGMTFSPGPWGWESGGTSI